MRPSIRSEISLRKTFTGFIFCLFFVLVLAPASAQNLQFKHIERFFDVRENIISQGEILPDIIRQTKGADMRTMERVFELNTSALTTIEAYFRIFKIAITAERGELTPDLVKVMNEWLVFVRNQCKYDIDYLAAALERTENEPVKKQVDISRQHIRELSEIAKQGIEENREALGEMTGQ